MSQEKIKHLFQWIKKNKGFIVTAFFALIIGTTACSNGKYEDKNSEPLSVTSDLALPVAPDGNTDVIKIGLEYPGYFFDIYFYSVIIMGIKYQRCIDIESCSYGFSTGSVVIISQNCDRIGAMDSS